jgi:hypothetical protein
VAPAEIFAPDLFANGQGGLPPWDAAIFNVPEDTQGSAECVTGMRLHLPSWLMSAK